MAHFGFAFDGKTDMMSLNPIEMTNFEMMGFIFGVGGVILTLVVSRLRSKWQQAHEFTGAETEEDSVEQVP